MELTDWHMWWKKRGGAGVRKLLMERWDPIGVGDMPEAADEYDSYVGTVGRMLREGATPEELSAYLTQVRTETMGLDHPDIKVREAEVSALLVEWYEIEMRTLER